VRQDDVPDVPGIESQRLDLRDGGLLLAQLSLVQRLPEVARQ
jgi:hypothetical protein